MSEKNKLLSSFKERTDKIIKDLPKFQPRGKDVYNKIISNTPKAPYVKNEGSDKKFPYLSSKHHTATISNPMQTGIRNKNAMTIAEEKKLKQDNRIGGNFAASSQGTRGSTLFDDGFNKNAEKNAKIAVKKHDYLTDAASKGELALKNALNNRTLPNKNGVMINAGRLVNELYPMKDTKSATNTGENSYAANPAGQSLKNTNNFQDLANRATGAQDLVDYISSGRTSFKQKLNNMKLDLDTPSFDVRTGY